MKKSIPESIINSAHEYRRQKEYPVQEIIAPLTPNNLTINKTTRIVTMGSCFAQELRSWLKKNGYNLLPHEWGVVYTPQNIQQILFYSFMTNQWEPSESFWKIKEKYYDPYRKANNHSGPELLGSNKSEAKKSLQNHYKKSREALLRADVIVLTFGLTETWENCNDEKAFYAVPFPQIYNPEIHKFKSLPYQEVYFYIEDSIKLIKSFTSAKILLSVSPVPLSVSFRSNLGAYIANQHSKSKIHTAVLEIVEAYGDVYYMPSYEIIKSDPKAYYKKDGRHINPRGINVIMNCFEKLYTKTK